MPDEPKPVEHSTEPEMLPIAESAAPPAPLNLGRDEAEETGTVENDEMEALLNPKKRDDAAPPDPPPPPPGVKVATREPAPWLWWLTLGLCCTALAVGVVYVLRARAHEARRRNPAGPGPAAPADRPAE